MTGEHDDPSAMSLLLSGAESTELLARTWRVEVIGGPDDGRSCTREFGVIIAGSSPEADLELSDPTVSRRHAELHLMPEGVLVVDLGSRNGTFVGPRKIDRGFVGPGGSVRLGQTDLRFTPLDRALDAEAPDRFGAFLTASPALSAKLGKLARAAKTDSAVFIEGENGTGKELLGRAVHAQSRRAGGPFVVFNCHLDHEALTAALETAQGGTLFLDGIAALSPAIQEQLLLAIDGPKPIDVRVVAASDRDRESLIKGGAFRADLYYRLAVVRVRVPPLRERSVDIAALAAYWARELSGGERKLSDDARLLLEAHDWPGNARELRAVIERAIAFGVISDEIRPEDLSVGQDFSCSLGTAFSPSTR